MDYEVKYALSGYDALILMDEYQFDVVITDLKMSHLGGMEVLSRVKTSHPDTMVIVISGRGYEDGGFRLSSQAVHTSRTTFRCSSSPRRKRNKLAKSKT